MSSYLTDAAAVVCALACIKLLRSWSRNRNKPPLPPGPKGLPLIGNVLDMPEVEEWEAVRKWSETYGPIIYLNIFGTSYIFLNSYEAAVELFEKRGAKYSSRPRMVMMELEGWSSWLPVVMPYGDMVRRSRQLFHRFLGPSAVGDYYELQEQSTQRMLKRLLKTPDKYFEISRYSAGETILMVTYGHKAAEKDDALIALAEKGMDSFAEAEGFFLVNAFPWLQYLPSWLPGTGFKKIASNGYKRSMAMYQEPYQMTKKKIQEGTAMPSMTSKLLEAYQTNDPVIDNESLIPTISATAYAGASDTTVSTMLTFLLAMVLHPDIQRRAQDEVDRMVGKNNLPSFKDRPNLPYVEAVCKECMRWQCVAPMATGVAHSPDEDDEYNGYFIPAGATVLCNVWAITKDPKVYEDPDRFIPERWLPAEGKEPPLDIDNIAFGFGRRICSGMDFANNSIFIGIASLLSAFNISKALDEHGQPVTPKVEYTSQFIRAFRHCKPFKYSLTPRSEEIVKAIHQAVDAAN
ncbi:hypothetical protein ACEPAI_2573 [Sanghuangporus weigelae]